LNSIANVKLEENEHYLRHFTISLAVKKLLIVYEVGIFTVDKYFMLLAAFCNNCCLAM